MFEHWHEPVLVDINITCERKEGGNIQLWIRRPDASAMAAAQNSGLCRIKTFIQLL